jgi:MFS family permease
MQNPTQEKTETAYSWYALALLTFVYVLNFLDRQIIYMLFTPIRAEMKFTDTQLALLGGTAFAIFYTLLGIPFGWIADKTSRARLIAAGLLVWSLFSGLTGFATDFWTLFACRVMVGVGEATLGPAAISLLADYFSPSKRATVTGIYSMGIAIGAGSAAFLGGYLSQFGWREAFFIVGFPGVVFAIFVFFLREPEKRKLAAGADQSPPISAAESEAPETSETLAGENRQASVVEPRSEGIFSLPFILLCLGYAFFGLATNNISVWAPTYFSRVFEIKISNYGYWAGVATLLAGIPATLFGGMLADWFRRRSVGGRMYFSAILSIVSVPCWLVALFTDNFAFIVPAGILLLFAGLAWLGAVAADATEIAGAKNRGVAVAIYFFSVNIAAFVIGANLIGAISDRLGSAQNPAMLRYALLVCPICCLLGAICLFFGGKARK